MLHIVNGDTVAEKLRECVVKDDILVWRELYSEGPIFADLTNSTNRSLRAQYLKKSMGIPCEEYIITGKTQEKILADFNKHEEIMLWFEYDLFDQSMLCYLLYWFAQQSLDKTKLSLLCIDTFPGIELFRGLGQLSVQQMQTLLVTRQSIGQEELDLGKKAWEAYASSDPCKLFQLLQEDTTALPFIQSAFELHLSRFPSIHNGLGIVEQTTLNMVHSGLTSPFELFKHVGGMLLHELGMGDLQYWHCLAKMSQGPYPLLHIEGLKTFPNYKSSSSIFHQCVIVLSELGRSVMNGREDWISLNGIDEWYGGVHLQGYTIPWRWDSSKKTIVMGNG